MIMERIREFEKCFIPYKVANKTKVIDPVDINQAKTHSSTFNMDHLLRLESEHRANPEPLSIQESSKLDQLLLESESLISLNRNSPMNLKIRQDQSTERGSVALSAHTQEKRPGNAFITDESCQGANHLHLFGFNANFANGIDSPGAFFTDSFMPEEIEK